MAGAAATNILVALSSSPWQIISARLLTGIFASVIPVAQAASTDLVPREMTGRAIARVAATAQMGVVIGPTIAALGAYVYTRAFALAPTLATRAVFATVAALAFAVIGLLSGVEAKGSEEAARKAEEATLEVA